MTLLRDLQMETIILAFKFGENPIDNDEEEEEEEEVEEEEEGSRQFVSVSKFSKIHLMIIG